MTIVTILLPFLSLGILATVHLNLAIVRALAFIKGRRKGLWMANSDITDRDKILFTIT